MQWAEVWRLLRPDLPMLLACAACAVVSVVANVLVAPSMGKGAEASAVVHTAVQWVLCCHCARRLLVLLQ